MLANDVATAICIIISGQYGNNNPPADYTQQQENSNPGERHLIRFISPR